MSKEIKNSVQELNNVMPGDRAQYLSTIEEAIKNWNSKFIVKDYYLQDYVGINEFSTTKDDILFTLDVVGNDKYSFVDFSTIDDTFILNTKWAKNYGNRFEEIKNSLCNYMCSCEQSEICTGFCKIVCNNLKKFDTTEDNVMNMFDKEFEELKKDVKEYYANINDEYYSEGPYGGAFSSEADYWRYREGYNLRY